MPSQALLDAQARAAARNPNIQNAYTTSQQTGVAPAVTPTVTATTPLNTTPVAPIVQPSVPTTTNTGPTADQLLSQIKSGQLVPSQSNSAWTSLYQNGQATQAQKDAYSQWDSLVKSGQVTFSPLGIPNTLPSAGTVPTPGTPLDVSKMNPNQGYIDLKKLIGASINGDGLLNGIDSQQAGLLALLGQSSEADKEQERVQNELVTAMKSLGMEGQDLQTAMDAQGVQQSYDQVKQLSLKAAQLQGEVQKFDVETLQGNETIGNQPIAEGFITGQQAQFQRQRALDKLAKTAELSAVTGLMQAYKGNAELGIELAQKSVDLKYAPILNQISTLEKQLTYVTANATKKDAERATIINNLLSDKKEQITKQKTDEAAIQKMAIDAALNGAPLDIVNQIKSSTDPVSAASLAQGYVKGATDKFTAVADGSALVDSNGNLIYNNEKDATGSNDPNRVLSPTEAAALGVPYGTTSAEAKGRTPTRPLTAEQEKNQGYANRMQNSNVKISDLEKTISSYNPAAFAAAVAAENTTLGNAFVPAEIKQLRQAERDFLNAKLRNESGAVISPTEFENGAKQYFPRPGDDAGTLQQKAQNRQQVINDLKNSIPNQSNTGTASDPLGIRPTGANDPLGLGREGSDSNAQKILGNAVPTTFALAVAKRYPTGADGGQCTTFLHKIAKFPPIGDWLSEKKKSVDKFGIPKAQWTPKLGDIVVTSDDPNYGHTFQINAILGNGKVQVTESNWKKDKNGDGIVTHNRIVDLNSPSIYGAIRPGLTSQEA